MRRWTVYDIEILKDGLMNGLDPDVLSQELGRSVSAILQFASRHDLSPLCIHEQEWTLEYLDLLYPVPHWSNVSNVSEEPIAKVDSFEPPDVDHLECDDITLNDASSIVPEMTLARIDWNNVDIIKDEPFSGHAFKTNVSNQTQTGYFLTPTTIVLST